MKNKRLLEYYKHWLIEKVWLVLPLMHSENKEHSDMFIKEFKELKAYADRSYEYEPYG